MTQGLSSSEGQEAREIVLDVSRLRVGYGGHTVLDGIDLRVHRGDFWFFVGPNGHGKTTLLRSMLGSLRPSAGRITFHGEFARADRIGFVPQQVSLNPAMPTTVREFVRLGMVGLRTSVAERSERLAWALRQVGLEAMQRKDIWSLSGGQRQRALVARALIRRPRLLIADEPTSGLDVSVEASLYEALTELNRAEQLTAILVTHDVGIAARYGTHLGVVHHGQVDAGPTREILDAGRLSEAYGFPIEVSAETTGLVNVRLGVAGTGQGMAKK